MKWKERIENLIITMLVGCVPGAFLGIYVFVKTPDLMLSHSILPFVLVVKWLSFSH